MKHVGYMLIITKLPIILFLSVVVVVVVVCC